MISIEKKEDREAKKVSEKFSLKATKKSHHLQNHPFMYLTSFFADKGLSSRSNNKLEEKV